MQLLSDIFSESSLSVFVFAALLVPGFVFVVYFPFVAESRLVPTPAEDYVAVHAK